ncbi:MAG: hypothetical protein IPO21_18450 [Bacteroidales bacterium]|nr:hypothetical protein [Bacteroidales bacterium]
MKKAFENKKEGLGLYNIINRAKTINADYTFTSSPGEGTFFEMKTSMNI